MSDQNKQQEEITEEQLAQGLNTDDSIAGTETLEEGKLDNDNAEDKLKQELSEARDKYVRLMAEFDNYKKRQARETMDLRQTAGREIIVSLLDVVDDSERALRTLESSDDLAQIKEGVSLVFHKLKTVLSQKGLRAMDAQGEAFDTELHEAITEIPAQDQRQQGKVLDVVQPGYYLNDKLIRHAKVVVGK